MPCLLRTDRRLFEAAAVFANVTATALLLEKDVYVPTRHRLVAGFSMPRYMYAPAPTPFTRPRGAMSR